MGKARDVWLWLAELWQLGRESGLWLLLAGSVGVAAGLASALFLVLLDSATRTRETSPWLIALLPVAGVVLVFIYHHYGAGAGRGSALVVEQLNAEHPADPRQAIPLRMAPFVLVGTVVTHLFGGSAGREGTAIQMGASLADALARRLRLNAERRHGLLAAGVAAGFGAVFGAPVAGMIFALEVPAVGRIRYSTLLPALMGAFVGDLTVRLLAVEHTLFPRLPEVPLETGLLLKVAAAGAVFGAAGWLFVALTEQVKTFHARYIGYPPLRGALGGAAVLAMTVLAGNTAYNGLSIPLITDVLNGASVPALAFLVKIVFTAVTIGSGFVGGEVTPLFVIGAALGASLSPLLGIEQGMLASIGLVAVFASASNTPLACALLGVELFGGGAPYLVVGCVVAYLVSGHRSIYATQRLHILKNSSGSALPDETIHEHHQRMRNSS
jgi:H+/Cl- antiporter ClcA